MNLIALRSLALAVLLLMFTALATKADELLAQGAFMGASGHTTSGTASLVQTASGTALVLESDFKFDGAPDPKVGFGAGGAYDPKSQLAASLDLSAYDEVYIWCQRYSVPLGVARLE
jgi:hypothetical protein